MQDIRWLALDLDRTIIGPDRIIRDFTLSVLRRACDDGYKLIIASGRPPRSIRPIIAQIDREIAFVAYNGGYAEAPDGEKLCDHRMDAVTATRTLNALRMGDPGAILMEANDHFHYDEWSEFAEFHSNRWPHKPTSVGNLDYHLRSGVNKLLAIGNKESITRTEKKLYEYASDQEIIRPTLYNDTEIDFIEVMPRGITKQVGIEAVLGRFGWKWSTGITFGDAINDITMMQSSKYSVAVEDSATELFAIASHRCASAKEEGVAYWLQSFLNTTASERAKVKKIAS